MRVCQPVGLGKRHSDRKRTVSAQDENCALVGQCDALIERKSADISSEEWVGSDLLRRRGHVHKTLKREVI